MRASHAYLVGMAAWRYAALSTYLLPLLPEGLLMLPCQYPCLPAP